MCQTLCFACLVVLRLRIPYLKVTQSYSNSQPNYRCENICRRMRYRNWASTVPSQIVCSRHVCGGQYLQCPALSGTGFLRICCTLFQISAETHDLHLIGYENHTASVTWGFEAVSLLFKQFLSARNFNASINSLPDGSKESNTYVVRVLDVSSLKLNVLCSFETSGTDYSVNRRHAPEQRSPQSYRCDDAKTFRFL